MENKGFLFMRSYYDAINDFDMSNEQKGYFISAIMEYVFDGVEPQFDKGLYKGCWTLIKPTLDNSINRYNLAVENGKKGGAPKGNNNAKKTTEEQPKINLKTTEEQPKINLKKEKDMDKEKDKEKYKEIELQYRNKKEIEINNNTSNERVEDTDFNFDEWVNNRNTIVEEIKPIKQKNSVFDI